MELKLSSLRKAYLLWIDSVPSNGGQCCRKGHFKHEDFSGEPMEDLPDEEVCYREQMWRRYTRLRDAWWDNRTWKFNRGIDEESQDFEDRGVHWGPNDGKGPKIGSC